MPDIRRNQSLGFFLVTFVTLGTLIGCDFRVIPPWERGGIRSYPRVSQQPQPKGNSPAPAKTPPPPRTMKTNFPPDHQGCPEPKEPWTKILLNKKRWEAGMTVQFDEPSKKSDGSSLTDLQNVSVYYHIIQQGAPGPLMLVTSIKATSKKGGKKNSAKISFSKLETLQRYLRARQDVFTVFCSRSTDTSGPGKMSPSLAIQFGRDNNWIPPQPKSSS